MSVRMFEEFQKKNTAFNYKKLNDRVDDDEKFCIQIPLKDSQLLKGKVDEDGAVKLDEEFIKVIEYEYAVRYLERMGTQATPQSIQRLLKKHPLSSCELGSGWNNSGALADLLYIYPMKCNKKNFDEHKDELGFASRPKIKRVRKTEEQLEEERLQELRDEDAKLRNQMGLVRDFTGLDSAKMQEQLRQMQKRLPQFKEDMKQLTFEKMQKEQEDERVEKKWKELNMGIDQWKGKYLYPFGDIAPISQADLKTQAQSQMTSILSKKSFQNRSQGFANDSILSSGGKPYHDSSQFMSVGQSQHQLSNILQMPDDAFKALTKYKYQFPVEFIKKRELLNELQTPLDLKVADLQNDFCKFVKDFPIEIIPHYTTQAAYQQNILKEEKKPEQELRRQLSQAVQKIARKENLTEQMTENAKRKLEAGNTKTQPQPAGNKLHYSHHVVSDQHIQLTFDEITSERIARMTGLLAHFVYWCTFGHINEMPLDDYHLKQLFISVAQAISQLNIHFSDSKKLFSSFIMPMILLAIRVEMEVILKVAYPRFMEVKENEVKTMRMVNGVITELLDPMVFYSRFSFLESGKEAIELKTKLTQQKQAKNETSAKLKFYARSALIKNLVPFPSEGRVRAKFCDYGDPSKRVLSEAGSQAIFGRNSINRSQSFYEQQQLKTQVSPYQNMSQMLPEDTELDQEAQLLELINKVQMFQIAGTRVNQSLMSRKMEPVFNLKYTEAFNNGNGKLNDDDSSKNL